MNAAKVTGYAKKPKKELIKAIDDCVSLSQLFALIQHENITMQMHFTTRRIKPCSKGSFSTRDYR